MALPKFAQRIAESARTACLTAIPLILASASALAVDQRGMFFLPAGLGLLKPQTGGVTSYIQSIQTVEITIAGGSTSNTASISSVTTTNSVIFYAGFTTASSNANSSFGRLTLTSATVVTANRNTNDASNSVTVRGTVVEFTSSAVIGTQFGTITITAGTSNTASISSVTTSRSAVFFLGNTTTATTAASGINMPAIDLTSSTVVTATLGASGTITVSFCVVEFQSAVIQSIQQRSVTQATSATTISDTISSVTTANTIIAFNGIHTSGLSLTSILYSVALTSSTNVTSTRQGSNTTTRTVKYTVIEFVSGVLTSNQRGSTALTGVASNNTSISAVSSTKAALNWNGFNTTGNSLANSYSTAKLTSTTNVQAQKNTATLNSSVAWEVPEFV